ncbi:MAG: hypothetical protein N4A62_21005 [Marinisporobacter sp.]|jgi:hypothetical protein|nr:hypothetical protein [Marinisporobacter sp.]
MSKFIREPLKIEELVAIDHKILEAYDLYVKKNTDFLDLQTIVYLDEAVAVDDETDEEIYPEFVIMNDLEWYFSGQVIIDIIDNTKYQLKNPSVQDYITNLNNYSEHDCFYTFNE